LCTLAIAGSTYWRETYDSKRGKASARGIDINYQQDSVAYPYYEIKDRAAIPMTTAMIPIFW
jgi:hypothetical protein